MNQEIYRSLSETAEELDLPQHVLRFWETKFTQIKPTKREGGQKFFRLADLDLLHGIRHLLYEEGHTIKGVQKLLEEQGIDWVISLQRKSNETTRTSNTNSQVDQFQSEKTEDPTYTRKKKTKTVAETDHIVEDTQDQPSLAIDETNPEVIPRDVIPENEPARGADKSSLGFLTLNRGHNSRSKRGKKGTGLTKDEVKRLNEALTELLECKRLLDQAST